MIIAEKRAEIKAKDELTVSEVSRLSENCVNGSGIIAPGGIFRAWNLSKIDLKTLCRIYYNTEHDELLIGPKTRRLHVYGTIDALAPQR